MKALVNHAPKNELSSYDQALIIRSHHMIERVPIKRVTLTVPSSHEHSLDVTEVLQSQTNHKKRCENVIKLPNRLPQKL